jgi:hypothetical protein
MKMVSYKTLAAGAIMAAAMSALPAQAVTTFATFSAPTANLQDPAYANFRWTNNGTGSSASGLGGSFDTITTSQLTAPTGSRAVLFSFTVPGLSPVATGLTAILTWTGPTAASQIATEAGGIYTQGGIGGTFSFISTSDITVGTNTYLAGANLLSGTYSDAAIVGAKGGNSADFDAETALGQSLVFTSDFINFGGVTNSAFALDLANIRSSLSTLYAPGNPTTPVTALRTFRTNANGSFGYDGEIVVNGIPEPQTWGLMVVGFGMVGLQVRRRNRRTTVAA